MCHLLAVISPSPPAQGVCVPASQGVQEAVDGGRQRPRWAGSRYTVEKISIDRAQNHLGFLLKRRFLFIPS